MALDLLLHQKCKRPGHYWARRCGLNRFVRSNICTLDAVLTFEPPTTAPSESSASACRENLIAATLGWWCSTALIGQISLDHATGLASDSDPTRVDPKPQYGL
jgi:hypothetical protein